jgi:hypothetical protein
MLKLTEMLFAKLCMADNKKVSDSSILGIAVWFSQFTVFTFFGSTLSESDIGRFLVEHEFSFNNELSITGVVD